MDILFLLWGRGELEGNVGWDIRGRLCGVKVESVGGLTIEVIAWGEGGEEGLFCCAWMFFGVN